MRKQSASQAKEEHTLKKNFLVVDDSELNLRVVQALLESHGIAATYVTSAEHAYSALQQADYDLILMDYLMPGTNGIEATQVIRKMTDGHTPEFYQNIPIIALTAEDNDELISTMLASGVNDVMTKPIQPGAFVAMLSKWAPTIHGIDEATLIGMLEADRKSYYELIDIFCQDIAGKHTRITEALVADDYASYTVEVHKIKSEVKVIGATALAEAAKTLEFAGKSITGVVPNGLSAEDNIKLIRRDTKKVLSALDLIGKELYDLAHDDEVTGSDDDSKPSVPNALDSELKKLSRYVAHALESLDGKDYILTREWLEEMNECLNKLI